MKEMLHLLQELQAIDLRAQELRKTITAAPAKLAPVIADLQKLEGMLGAARKQLAENEKWKAEQEGVIKREEEAVRAAKLKLQASRNSKDFGAANREIENKRKSVSEREDEVLKVITAIEGMRTTITNGEKDIAALREHVAKEEADIKTNLVEIDKELKERVAARSELVKKVPTELMKRYEVVIKRRGVALAKVESGLCQGCFMSLPPQLSNIIARMTSIESCPQCYRLLYRDEMLA